MQGRLIITNGHHLCNISKLQFFEQLFEPKSSQVTEAVAQYSASALYCATLCFLILQEILPQIRMQYPKVDPLSVEEPAQSESEYLTTRVWPLSSYLWRHLYP